MHTDTFRNWLAAQGCTFEQGARGRDGRGHPVMVVRRDGKHAELAFAGANEDLDHREVLRVVEALGLDWSSLPGPASRA